MQTYRVLIRGTGLEVRRWWLFRRRLGFYVTRFVHAADADQAAVLALADVRDDPKLLTAAIQTPRLAVDVVERVVQSPPQELQQGFVFFQEP